MFHRGSIRILTVVYVVAASLVLAAPASAQPAPAVARAQSLRNSGELAEAARILRAHLDQYPDDGDAARLLAQTLYWLKDVRGAKVEYEDALRRHPSDTALRTQYARMLIETGSLTRATEVLSVLPDDAPGRSDADVVLGLAAYWQNDLSTARRRFEQALALNPSNHEAKGHLEDVQAATAPWIRASTSAWHDDQPLDRVSFGAEAGWFASPNTSIAVRGAPARYTSDAAARTIGSFEAGLRTYVPSAKADLEFTLGRSSGSATAAGTSTWTGLARATLHVSSAVRVGGRVSRNRYLYTVAAIGGPVMVTTETGFLHLDRKGWLGEAALERQQYPDDNSVRAMYAWLLAPVARSAAGVAQLGYAISFSDADHSRFMLRAPIQPFPIGDPRFDLSGLYDPYYTPDRVTTHSISGAVAAGSPRVSFRASASYGFRAHDNAPFFTPVNGVLIQSTAPRTFTPWQARASVSIAAGRSMTVEPTAEIGKTVFYSWATAGIDLRWRIRPMSR